MLDNITMKKINEIKKEINEKKIAIPKTNEQFIDEFKDSIRRYMSFGATSWEQAKNGDFYIRFNGITDTNTFHIVGREDLKEYIESQFNNISSSYKSDVDTVFNKLLNTWFNEILNFATLKYTEKIYDWTEDIIFDDELPPIKEDLLKYKEKILEESSSLPIYNFLKENFDECMNIIADGIYDFRNNSNSNR